MSEKKGWIKLERHLSNKTFSRNVQLNTDCYLIYSYLVEKAAWGEHDGLQRGQLRFKAKDIQKDVYPDMPLHRIKKIIRTLAEVNYVKSAFISAYKPDGMLLEICHYDDFGGETCQKEVNLNCTMTVPSLNLVNLDKQSELLDKNHVEMTECALTVPSLYLDCNHTECSCIIEEKKERKRRKKETDNTVSCADAHAPKNSNAIIINDPIIKPKKRNNGLEEIDHKEALDTFYRCYEERYGVKPLINGTVITHLKRIIQRTSYKDAPRLIAFYLTHNNSFYLSKAHSIEYALKDCEKLHTEMNKHDYIFNRDAKKVEDATANNILKESILKRIRNGEL